MPLDLVGCCSCKNIPMTIYSPGEILAGLLQPYRPELGLAGTAANCPDSQSHQFLLAVRLAVTECNRNHQAGSLPVKAGPSPADLCQTDSATFKTRLQ